MEPQRTILAVDDEPGILRLLSMELENEGFRVITARGGKEAIEAVEKEKPDIILLDLMMPDVNGVEVMRRIYPHSKVPIIFVSARDKEQERVRLLEAGAEDYILKPFSPEELAARVRAVLRRRSGKAETERVVHAKGVEIDLERRLVKRGGALVSLTRTEWMLLHHLALNAGKTVLNAELLSNVWGVEYRQDLQYLRVWVSRLRQKLEPDREHPAILITIPGVGYVLKPDEETVEEAEEDMALAVEH
ncbi:MAG: response regulator transcription factor [Tepidiformaceae bacterium]